MKSPLLLGVALTAGLLGLAAAATAKPGGPEGHGGMMGRHMQEADTNKDGAVSRAELEAAAQKRFDAADVNGDGQLSQEEAQAARQKAKQEKREAFWTKRDANGDGTLSRDEAMGPMLDHFDKIDTNKDGVISEDERKAARSVMREMWKERGKSE